LLFEIKFSLSNKFVPLFKKYILQVKKVYNILVHSDNLIEELSVGVNVFLIFIEKNKL